MICLGRLQAGALELHLPLPAFVAGAAGSVLSAAVLMQASEADGQDPRRVIELAMSTRASYCHVVPSLLAAWNADAFCAEALGTGACALRLCTSGGEALHLPVARGFHAARGSATRLLNIYGVSEAGALRCPPGYACCAGLDVQQGVA